MEKRYYKIVFKLETALSLGSGTNKNSDKDVMLDGQNQPFIPGTSLAGIYRSFYSKEDKIKYFGDVKNATKDNPTSYSKESKVIVYDALLHQDENSFSNEGDISIRDGVGLDEYKVGKKGAKFDFETVSAGTKFVTYIEQNYETGDKDIAGELICRWLEEGLLIGAKTKRGLGKTVITSVSQKHFLLPNQLPDWIPFHMYDKETEWDVFGKEKHSYNKAEEVKLQLELRQAGGISIREYTTDVSTDEKTMPDYRQKKIFLDGREYALIPGTSWAGAFYHQMRKLGLKDDAIKAVFGRHDENAKKSLIRFSESYILLGDGELEGKEKQLTRVAIDRFTGGAITGALYTEKFVYAGKTKLDISIPNNVDMAFKQTLAAAIVDLDCGFMAVGGLTSVGRGLFHIDRVNGEEFPAKIAEKYAFVLRKLEEGNVKGGTVNG